MRQREQSAKQQDTPLNLNGRRTPSLQQRRLMREERVAGLKTCSPQPPNNVPSRSSRRLPRVTHERLAGVKMTNKAVSPTRAMTSLSATLAENSACHAFLYKSFAVELRLSARDLDVCCSTVHLAAGGCKIVSVYPLFEKLT